MPRIRLAVPQLPSLDLDRAIEFYTTRLGMWLLARYEGFALLVRDGVELHFWACMDPELPRSSSCYWRVEGIEALHEEFAGRGVEFRHPLQTQPWGMKEFLLSDPDGNNVRIGEAVA